MEQKEDITTDIFIMRIMIAEKAIFSYKAIAEYINKHYVVYNITEEAVKNIYNNTRKSYGIFIKNRSLNSRYQSELTAKGIDKLRELYDKTSVQILRKTINLDKEVLMRHFNISSRDLEFYIGSKVDC